MQRCNVCGTELTPVDLEANNRIADLGKICTDCVDMAEDFGIEVLT
jgi:hypothetical protein